MTDWQAVGEVFSFTRQGDETIFCAFNLGPDAARVTLPAGAWQAIGTELGGVATTAATVDLPGWGCILARKG